MRPVRKGSAFGRSKEDQGVLTGPCLRPVMDHRTRPVSIPEELDLSGIDWTLGGSVRSLPPERPVSGSRTASGLFSPFPFLSCLGELFNRILFLYPTVTKPPSPSQRRHSRALASAPKLAVLPELTEPTALRSLRTPPRLPCPAGVCPCAAPTLAHERV